MEHSKKRCGEDPRRFYYFCLAYGQETILTYNVPDVPLVSDYAITFSF